MVAEFKLQKGWYILHSIGSVDVALASRVCYPSHVAALRARDEDFEVKEHSNGVAYWDGSDWTGYQEL